MSKTSVKSSPFLNSLVIQFYFRVRLRLSRESYMYIYMRVIIDTTLSLSLYLLRVSKRQKGRGKRDAWKRESVYAKILTTFPWWKIAPRTSPIGNPSYKSADTTNSTPLNKTKSRSFHRSKTHEGNAHTTNRWSRLGRGLMRRTKKMSTRSADTAVVWGI